MLAFEVLVNGKQLCIASTTISDVMSTGVTWTRREGKSIHFNVGGIIAGDSYKHFGWTTPEVGIGDEITIRLIDADSGSKPDHVYEPARNPEAGATPK